ncbi:MAG: sulfotransferase [Halioglobus sp.]|nr:sulfotransferase [Halioglobus sp.]
MEKPDDAQLRHEHRAAQLALREGRLRDAHQHCLTILKADRKHADAWFLCGVIAASNGLHTKAEQIIRNAIALAPGNAQYQAELGKELLVLRRTQEAMASAESALTLQPADVPTLNTLGTVFSHAGEQERALACFDRAVDALGRGEKAQRFRPVFRAEIHYNRGIALQFAGRFDEAEAEFEQAISINPVGFSAHSALASLRRQTPESHHLARLTALREQVRTASDQLHVGHALAKEQEDLGQYPESLASLAWAKAAKAREVRYRASDDAALFRHIRSLFPGHADLGGGCTSPEPIFIVGMPRTGTTLVERILGGHSTVFAAGELNAFPRQVKALSGSTSAEDLDRETLSQAARQDMASLGRAYLESTRPRTGHTPHFIDKLPLNFLYLGFIRAALPNAKLVCLRRDPMDTCLSNYRQLFATNFRYYYYNLDLLDCGRYYIEFDRLMRHWRQCMPGAVFELQYEALVQDPETVARALLEFCELPWEDACLDFQHRSGSVATPSAVQVRQGIYQTSVNRWQRYGEALQPLYHLLRDAGCYD